MRAMKLRKEPVPRIDERFAFFRLRLDRSPIHRFGMFAAETIPAGRKVIEYVGQRISSRESLQRCVKAFESGRKPILYLFRLGDGTVIDGSVGGGGAEYVNHSCAPNMRAIAEDGHINYWSRRRIAAGEELTVDYRFPRRGPPVHCNCGAPRCRGTINLK